MKRQATQSDSGTSANHGARFQAVLESRKRKVPSLWQRGSRYYAQLRIDGVLVGKVYGHLADTTRKLQRKSWCSSLRHKDGKRGGKGRLWRFLDDRGMQLSITVHNE